jgi:hypothetical protein
MRSALVLVPKHEQSYSLQLMSCVLAEAVACDILNHLPSHSCVLTAVLLLSPTNYIAKNRRVYYIGAPAGGGMYTKALPLMSPLNSLF